MSEFLIWSALYHNEPTFKRTRNFCVNNFWNFQFYTLLRCDFLTLQNHAFHFAWIANSSQIQTSTWAGARFPSARQRMCAPNRELIFSNPLSYHTETSSAQKSNFQAYTTHEAIFQIFWASNWRFWARLDFQMWHHVLQKMPTSEKTKDKFPNKLFRTLQCIYLAN